MKYRLALVSALVLLSGCTAGHRESADAAAGTAVTVWYATDRARDGESGPSLGYHDGRDVLGFGVARVTIPASHVAGRLEAPPFKSPAGLADRRWHVYLDSARPLPRGAFVADLRGALDRARRREILVFIHGYNTDFGLAMRRMAQITHDIDFAGVAVAFSWPSAGRATAYLPDQNNADWAAPDLAETLALLARETGAARIHLYAHSMGNRILLNAFDALARDGAGGGAPLFAEVVMAAPDVDADIFAVTVPRLRHLAARITLYVSDGDMAMAAARRVAGGHPRAGDSRDRITVLDGVETVDASAVRDDLFGHEYFGESRPVLDDIRVLVNQDAGAAERPRLAPRVHRGRAYWRLLPPGAES